MSNITWIKGQNSSGKTVLIKKMLGAKIEYDSDMKVIFNTTITIPKHISIQHKASQIHIFIEKEKGLWRDYNKIFRLYDQFVTQSDVVAKQEERIRETQNKIKGVKDDNERIQKQYHERMKSLVERIEEKNRLHTEMDTIYANPIYAKYQELLTVWCKEHNTNRNSELAKTMWTELHGYKEKNKVVLESLNTHLQELFDVDKKFMWSHEEVELEKEKANPPELYEAYRDEWGLDALVKHLGRIKRSRVKEDDILALIQSYHSKKMVWIDGKPSSDFSDFYDMIMKVKDLSPDRLFISHCGNERWFKALPNTLYTLSSGKKTMLDLSVMFDSIFIEVPSMDEKVVVVGESQ